MVDFFKNIFDILHLNPEGLSDDKSALAQVWCDTNPLPKSVKKYSPSLTLL